MKFGKIQIDIITYLQRCDPVKGGYIGSTCKAKEFRGLDWEQVEQALNRLLKRKIIRKEGPLPRYILTRVITPFTGRKL